MLPLPARLTIEPKPSDNRGATRRSLRLEVQASSPNNVSSALIRNLSERGLLIETAIDLAVGETIQVALPEAGTCEAQVIWRDRSFAGCEFLRPVPRAAVSAALLLAPVERPAEARLADRPVQPPFADDPAEADYQPEPYSPAVDLMMKVSLAVALLMAALFIYALLTFPFSV